MSPQCDGDCSLQQAWNLTEGQTNRDVLMLMFSEHPNLFVPTPEASTLCVPGGEYTPLLYLSKDAEVHPKPMSADEQLQAKANFCICMVTDMAEDRRVWQLLQAYGPDGTMVPENSQGEGARGAGLALLTDSEKIPTGVGQSVANLGLVGLYVTVVLNMARGLKLAREKLLRNLMYDDRDAADFIYQLCQDLLTVRKIAKLNPDYFQFEEMLWLKLQSYLRDQGELLTVTRQAKHDRMQARAQEFSDSSEEEEEGDPSSDSDSSSDNDDDDDDNGQGSGQQPTASPSGDGRLRRRATTSA
eukprot:COSAG02_NODE_1791_length_10920_cov_62.356067_7_plen_300_part_00